MDKKVLNFLEKNNINYEIKEKNIYIGGSLRLDGLKEIPEGFNLTVGGDLWLDGLKEIPEGFNPTVGGSLRLDGLKEIPEGFNPTVGGSLWLDGLKEIPEGFNPTVGGSLRLDGLKEIPEGFNPTVGGSLWLDGLKEIPEGFNPTVGGSLRLDGLKEIPEGFNLTVGGDLWLDGLKEIPEGFNPTVGGDLWLNGLKEIPEGFNLTVGGDLWLKGLKEIPEGFNPTVGGSLWLNSSKGKCKKIENVQKFKLELYVKLNLNLKLSWQNGKYRKIDGIFCEVLKQNKNILKVKTKNKIGFIFLKDNIAAHGNTIKQAYYDWIFKTSDRDINEYKNIKNSDIQSLGYWITAYRTITGACSFGTNQYLENNKDKYKDNMTLNEVIEATKGQYGHNTFTEFFKENQLL